MQEAELKSLRWEHEVLEQRFAQVRTVQVIMYMTLYNVHGIALFIVYTDSEGER